MLVLILIAYTLLFIPIALLFSKISIIEGKLEKKEPEVGDIVLKALKPMPVIDDIDPDYQLLKDVIETAKLESWDTTIKRDYRDWEFNIANSSRSICIRSKIRESIITNRPEVDWFTLKVDNRASIQYHYGKSKICEYFILEYLWSLLVEENEKEYSNQVSYITKTKELVEKELTLLRRNEKLKSILGN